MKKGKGKKWGKKVPRDSHGRTRVNPQLFWQDRQSSRSETLGLDMLMFRQIISVQCLRNNGNLLIMTEASENA